jgi:ABC-type histidine transport system ATPase subunit
MVRAFLGFAHITLVREVSALGLSALSSAIASGTEGSRVVELAGLSRVLCVPQIQRIFVHVPMIGLVYFQFNLWTQRPVLQVLATHPRDVLVPQNFDPL